MEELIPYLDLESIEQLAKSHKLTRQILGKSLIWNQLLKSTFPKVNNIDPEEDFPLEDWPCDYADLASDKAKVRLLTGILSLSEDSDRSQLRMDLVHKIGKRHPILPPILEPNNRRLVDVGCFCGQTHTVSILDFLLLREVVTREQESILCVERLKARILYD